MCHTIKRVSAAHPKVGDLHSPPGWEVGQAECRAGCSAEHIFQLSDQGEVNLGKQACYADIAWLVFFSGSSSVEAFHCHF